MLGLNGTPVRAVTLENGATRGSLEGARLVAQAVLRGAALPRAALVAGENVITIDKPSGSWHAYDALGVFER